MKRVCKYLVTCLVFLHFCSIPVFAQEQERFRSFGGMFGLGHRISHPGAYNLYFFMARWNWQIGKKMKTLFFTFFTEPQVNLVRYTGEVHSEIANCIGIKAYQQLSPDFYLYELIGSGPQYNTADLPEQADGFIFSDNIAVGLMKSIGKEQDVFLDLQLRLRHISNAGLQDPNNGINSINMLIGITHLK